MDTYYGDCPENSVQKHEPVKLQMSIIKRQPNVREEEQQQNTRAHLDRHV